MIVHRLILIGLLAALPTLVAAAPPAGDRSREILIGQMAALQADPLFASLKLSGGKIVEFVGYEGGLYIRYWLNQVECSGQWSLDSETGREGLKLDLKCPLPARPLRNLDERYGRAAEDLRVELVQMQSAIRFVSHSPLMEPAVTRTLGVRRENDKLIVAYLAQTALGPKQCMVTLWAAPASRKDTPVWYAYRPACETY